MHQYSLASFVIERERRTGGKVRQQATEQIKTSAQKQRNHWLGYELLQEVKACFRQTDKLINNEWFLHFILLPHSGRICHNNISPSVQQPNLRPLKRFISYEKHTRGKSKSLPFLRDLCSVVTHQFQ